MVKLIQQTPECINAYNVTGEDSWVLEIAVIDVAHLDAVVSKFCDPHRDRHLHHPQPGARAHRGDAAAAPRGRKTPIRESDPRMAPRPTSPPATSAMPTRPYAEGDAAFRVLPPVFANYGGRARFCGAVLTVKCFEDNSPVKAALESAGEGRVLVVDGGGSLRRALIGSNIAGGGDGRNGWAGVVIDGAARDKTELAAADVGIRALALMPMPTDRKTPSQTGVPVLIQGVWVRTGDWLYADEDGIVVMAGKAWLWPVPPAVPASAIASSFVVGLVDQLAGHVVAVRGSHVEVAMAAEG